MRTAEAGPIGRLGRWTATHFGVVLGIWLVIAVGLGFFAPKAEHALSGAGWEATGSESVEARDVVAREFQGLGGSAMMVVLTSKTATIDDPAYQQAIADVGLQAQTRQRGNATVVNHQAGTQRVLGQTKAGLQLWKQRPGAALNFVAGVGTQTQPVWQMPLAARLH